MSLLKSVIDLSAVVEPKDCFSCERAYYKIVGSSHAGVVSVDLVENIFVQSIGCNFFYLYIEISDFEFWIECIAC